MPVAAAYQIDLYCDHSRYGESEVSTCKDTRYNGSSDSFTGETWGEAARAARAEGWRISRDRTKAFCPYCTGMKKL